MRRRRYDPWPDMAREYTAWQQSLYRRLGGVDDREVVAALRVGKFVFESFTIYATMGRDRRKLGPEWVERMKADLPSI